MALVGLVVGWSGRVPLMVLVEFVVGTNVGRVFRIMTIGGVLGWC